MTAEQAESSIDWSLAILKNDRFAKLLLQNSHLTEVQLATLIIDALWTTPQSPNDEGKSRSSRRKVSKGAFSRSLAQARGNVVKAIYTVFVLAYFGLFDSPKLEPFLRLGAEMKSFLDAKQETGIKNDVEARDAVKTLAKALEDSIGDLAKMNSFKRQRDIV